MNIMHRVLSNSEAKIMTTIWEKTSKKKNHDTVILQTSQLITFPVKRSHRRPSGNGSSPELAAGNTF